MHIVRERARTRGREEQQLGRVGVCDVDDDGTDVFSLADGTDDGAELPGDVTVERREHAGVFLGFERLDLCPTGARWDQTIVQRRLPIPIRVRA